MSRYITFTLMMLFALSPSMTIAQEELAEEVKPSSIYFEIDPAFVLNYGNGTSGRLKFLRAELTLRLDTAGSVISDVNQHMPVIRHAIIMYLSKQSSERINDATQRDAIRLELLDQVQQALSSAGGSDGVQDLLFNAFLVQR